MAKISNGSVYEHDYSQGIGTDFIGFTYDGVHSSELGILRVSEGDRYSASLLPSANAKTVQVPGGDGTYYFGTLFPSKNFNICIAYDSLTQAQLERLYILFANRKPVELIFDELPYKVYLVKPSNDIQLTNICFMEDGKRIYKGEGTIQLITYRPFAKSRFKYLEDYNEGNIPEWKGSSNLDEWIEGSGIQAKGEHDKYNKSLAKILCYNGGQAPTDFNLYISFVSDEIPAFYIELDNNEDRLFCNAMQKQNPNDVKIKINTRINLIEGVDENNKTTGSIYNQFIEKGHFFKLPLGESELHTGGGISDEEIEYSYLYY